MEIKRNEIFSKLFSGVHGKQEKEKHKPQAKEPKPELIEPKFVIFIIDWNRLKDIKGVFEKEKEGFHYIIKGRGTASSEITDLLGIGASAKAVIINLEQPEAVPVLLKDVRKSLGGSSQSAGIAFIVPLSGINSPLLRVFRHPEPPEDPSLVKKEKSVKKTEFTHSLIVSLINQGYSEEFMNTARKAGATGGTVIDARKQTNEGAVKIFGISVQNEQEIILMLISQERKEAVMQAVFNAHGPGSKAHALMFSMPVDRVMSLSFEQAFNA